MKLRNFFRLVLALVMASLPGGALSAALAGDISPADTTDDLVFIHHSCGQNWLDDSLNDALVAKDYIDERNDITYGTDVAPDSGRPDSLGSVPGDNTNMNHWVLWFNDYLQGVKSYGAATGFNRIIMFKSCYPISNVTDDGTEPGDPFSDSQTIANYKAVYRHPGGSGNTYSYDGYTYKPLEDIFAENPNILFIPVTAPPRHYSPSDATDDAEAHRARLFNNWLKNDWLAAYKAAHPGLNNVAVFDWFNLLAYADDHATHPNRLKAEYGGTGGDSHPNSTANSYSTQIFATNSGNFIDAAWQAFIGVLDLSPSYKTVHTTGPVKQGDLLTYTVVVRNGNGNYTSTIELTDTIPGGLAYVPGTLTATGGIVTDTANPTLRWSGTLSTVSIITVTYAVTVTASTTQTIVNTATIASSGYLGVTPNAMIIANGANYYLPWLSKQW